MWKFFLMVYEIKKKMTIEFDISVSSESLERCVTGIVENIMMKQKNLLDLESFWIKYWHDG